MTICVNLLKVSLRSHPRPTKSEPVWVRPLRLHVEPAPPGLPVKPGPDRAGDSYVPSQFLSDPCCSPQRPAWHCLSAAVNPRQCPSRAKDTWRERQGLEHLEEWQSPVAKSTLVLTTNDLALGLVSATLPPLGWMTLGQSQICCHCQGYRAA